MSLTRPSPPSSRPPSAATPKPPGGLPPRVVRRSPPPPDVAISPLRPGSRGRPPLTLDFSDCCDTRPALKTPKCPTRKVSSPKPPSTHAMKSKGKRPRPSSLDTALLTGFAR
eukprot:gnl/TRDRNA2_/TRDRNA2_92815_c1_seq1.p1 gnl/TRDRNA2_/TRDRNA2_92815_c1~~gnl/TRDRNA2_/TRDRNA2_92815_c1_seq1.p1  ORF type:complete len:112 (+),score=1.55 gnl/TRDRNA2_/TRDRNA2_92815_c1_seq1:2-337(+)